MNGATSSEESSEKEDKDGAEVTFERGQVSVTVLMGQEDEDEGEEEDELPKLSEVHAKETRDAGSTRREDQREDARVEVEAASVGDDAGESEDDSTELLEDGDDESGEEEDEDYEEEEDEDYEEEEDEDYEEEDYEEEEEEDEYYEEAEEEAAFAEESVAKKSTTGDLASKASKGRIDLLR